MQDFDFYREGMFIFVPRLDECIEALGDYAEQREVSGISWIPCPLTF
jgi:hypothetical protein